MNQKGDYSIQFTRESGRASLDWRDPPARGGPRAQARSDLNKALNILHSNPDKWARLWTLQTHAQASGRQSWAYRWSQDWVKKYEVKGHLEFVVRTTEDGQSVFARYLDGPREGITQIHEWRAK